MPSFCIRKISLATPPRHLRRFNSSQRSCHSVFSFQHASSKYAYLHFRARQKSFLPRNFSLQLADGIHHGNSTLNSDIETSTSELHLQCRHLNLKINTSTLKYIFRLCNPCLGCTQLFPQARKLELRSLLHTLLQPSRSSSSSRSSARCSFRSPQALAVLFVLLLQARDTLHFFRN